VLFDTDRFRNARELSKRSYWFLGRMENMQRSE